jgi:methyl-accepting chemotaxis protein
MKLQINLSLKITIIISITLIIVLGLTGLFLYDYLSDITLENLTIESGLNADIISQDISNIFENAKLATEYLSQHNNIQQYLKTVETKEDILSSPYIESVFKALYDVVEFSETHFLTWIANEKANFYIDSLGYSSGDDYDVKIRPWYAVALEADDVGLTTPYVEWETGEVVISSIKALYDTEGENYGFIGVDIVLDDIPGLINMMKQGVTDMSYLIARDGSYVYTEESDKMVDGNMFDFSEVFYPYINHILKSDGSLLDVTLNNNNYFLLSHNVDERGWKIVTLIDRDRVDSLVQERSYLIIAIISLGLVISIGMVFIQTKITMNPFGILVDYSKEIVAGDFSRNVPEKYTTRKDEMGELSRSFQSISDTFRNVNTKLEEEIIKKNNELESQFLMLVEQEKQASLGYMVTGVAHEINTPLGNSLSLSTYLDKITNGLKDKYEIGKMSKSDFEHYFEVHDESSRILIESLSDAAEIIKNFKMISIDQTTESKQRFVLKSIFNALTISLKNELQISNCAIAITCDETLTMTSYPGSLTQVMSQLIINSTRHGFDNDREGHIEISVTVKSNDIIINYKDDGIGMTTESLDKMYEIFYTTNRSHGSIGLGMYIVFNTISQKLNGTIVFAGKPHQGVEFIITIPKK